jgi:FkbM family methyltransferase
MDLGANRGIFTLYAALKAKRIIAVEANPAVMAQCIANLYINQLANRCIFVQAAVARKPGVRKLKITDGTIDSSIVRNAPSPTRRTIVVPSIALSTLVRKWAPVDLLKMDIEGSEFELMQHAVKDGWLSRVNRLVLEYHDCVPGWDCVAASRMIVAKLEGAGFRVTHVVSGRLIYAVKSGLQ